MNILKEFENDSVRPALLKGLKLSTELFGKNITVVETGTIRSYKEQSKSTIKIAEYLKLNGGNLITVDIEENHINISKDVCRNYDNITYIISDSIQYLSNLSNPVHMFYLDSVNNAKHIFDEFKISVNKIVDNGYIIVDDYIQGVKCDAIVSYLNTNNYKFEIHNHQILIKVTPELKQLQ